MHHATRVLVVLLFTYSRTNPVLSTSSKSIYQHFHRRNYGSRLPDAVDFEGRASGGQKCVNCILWNFLHSELVIQIVLVQAQSAQLTSLRRQTWQAWDESYQQQAQGTERKLGIPNIEIGRFTFTRSLLLRTKS